jgi:hypothetical protein
MDRQQKPYFAERQAPGPLGDDPLGDPASTPKRRSTNTHTHADSGANTFTSAWTRVNRHHPRHSGDLAATAPDADTNTSFSGATTADANAQACGLTSTQRKREEAEALEENKNENERLRKANEELKIQVGALRELLDLAWATNATKQNQEQRKD